MPLALTSDRSSRKKYRKTDHKQSSHYFEIASTRKLKNSFLIENEQERREAVKKFSRKDCILSSVNTGGEMKKTLPLVDDVGEIKKTVPLVNDDGEIKKTVPFLNDVGEIKKTVPFINDVGEIKKTVPFINDDGEIKKTVPFINDDGEIKKTVPFLNDDGEIKKTLPFGNDVGEIKKTVPFINDDGEIKKTLPFINDDGETKETMFSDEVQFNCDSKETEVQTSPYFREKSSTPLREKMCSNISLLSTRQLEKPTKRNDVKERSVQNMALIDNDGCCHRDKILRVIPPGLQKFFTLKFKPPESPFHLIQEHLYKDPWQLLVATIFLNKTNGINALPVLWKFFECFPNAEVTACANLSDITDIIRSLGLQRKRAYILKRFSKEYLNKMWQYPIELYGIGKYGNDSFRIFCLGEYEDVFPDDYKLNLYYNWHCHYSSC
ncbi:uncharacterized protein LOC124439284 [Xenia sp. Carnegie-2017]|uniref:uncharacterized protein LOC124439284 n=1 Tax=Xenia sp. Carnegie-2017 TaxID=2897299 RepID=UPI001F04E283|nr:uncharacterized protein LOC124439284 [Xenia sp. Carnegie-2017]